MDFKAKDNRLNGNTVLRQCQLVQVYMLDIFVEICERHGLTYFLDGGTLLGAMRHNGFIPWDDDLDVGMPVKDYKRFLKIADSELPESILLQTPQKYKGVAMPYAKLRDRYSFYGEGDGANLNLPLGIFMDIFPYDKFPKLPVKIMNPIVNWCEKSWTSERAYRTYLNGSVTEIFISGIKGAVWHFLYCCSKSLFYLLNLCFKTGLKISPEVGFGYYSAFDFEDIFPLQQHVFEGKMYNIPNKADDFLRRKFGDWRKPPTKEQLRRHHSFICPTQAPNVWWALPYPYSKNSESKA